MKRDPAGSDSTKTKKFVMGLPQNVAHVDTVLREKKSQTFFFLLVNLPYKDFALKNFHNSHEAISDLFSINFKVNSFNFLYV